MEDLIYTLQLGFSGSDMIRAVIISFFCAMVVSKKRPAWMLCLWALLIDRLIWPLTDMMIRGTHNAIIGGVLDGMLKSFNADLPVYFIRYFVLLLLILGFATLRRRINKPKNDKSKGKPATA